jgi:Resolvase, N terminal domain
MNMIGYARVSTSDQNTAAQVEKLQAAGCIDILGGRRRGRVARLVVQKNPALPIVRMNAENLVGEEKDRDAGSGRRQET